MLHDFLHYIEEKSQTEKGDWQTFYSQLFYLLVEISPKSCEVVKTRNKSFIEKAKLEVRNQDALQFLESRKAHPLKGIILSNELFDNFSGHQIRLKQDGRVEVALFLPVTNRQGMQRLYENQVIDKDELTTLPVEDYPQKLIISKGDFLKIKDQLTETHFQPIREKLRGYFGLATAYIDANAIPEVADYIVTHKKEIALAIAHASEDIHLFISPQHKKIIQSMAGVLEKGYVLTIDYLLPSKNVLDPEQIQLQHFYEKGKIIDPLIDLGVYDLTFIYDATYLALLGETRQLRVLFFGNQSNVKNNIGIDLADPPQQRRVYENGFRKKVENSLAEYAVAFDNPQSPKEGLEDEFILSYVKGLPQAILLEGKTAKQYAEEFIQPRKEFFRIIGYSDPSFMVKTYETIASRFINEASEETKQHISDFNHPRFKVLIQQKVGTDDLYAFSGIPEPLFSDETKISNYIRSRARVIEETLEKRYGGVPIEEIIMMSL